MFTQHVTARFEGQSQSIVAFMAMYDDRPHWLPIHSLTLMIDQQLHCASLSQNVSCELV